MPWHVVEDHADCPAGKPWAVVKDADGSVAGCHASEADADAQVAALYAAEGNDAGNADELGGKPNSGTKKDKRLRENKMADAPEPDEDGNCPEGYRKMPNGACLPATPPGRSTGDVETWELTDGGTFAWDGSAGRYSDEQYERAAAACDPGEGTVKARCFLPHHDPGGALNRDGVHAAAQRASALKGRSPDAVRRAKAHLRRHYGELDEEPPDSLKARAEDRLLEATGADSVDVTDDAVVLSFDGDVETSADEMPATWTGVLAVEGITTGDQREFAEGSLTWADPPLTLRWNVEDSHGGETRTKAVAVGKITEIWRDGNKIMGRGDFDLGSEDGREARRRVHEQYLRGISIDADDITDADVELVWPEAGPGDADEDEGSIFDLLFASPEKVIYHKGRIRASTLCDIPAFVEAYIALDGDGEELVAAARPVFVAPRHETATSDAAWNAKELLAKLPAILTASLAEKIFGWVDQNAVQNHTVARDACRFLHHELDATGAPGAANLTACAAAIASLNGVAADAVPPSHRHGIYRHLAAHLRDASREAPPLEPLDALTASVAELDARRPPRAWFDNPRLSVPMGIIVTDEGRVYGHAAQFGECHVGFPDACVTAPYEDDHPYFLTGEVACDDGTRVAVGQITVGTGHAPLSYGASRAAEHYDDTGAAVADVAVGNDEHGIWVAGAIRPHAEATRVHDLRASGRVSGDWRRIGGALRLVGLLGVNVAGFQIPRVRSRIASGQQVALVAAGQVTVGPKPITEAELADRALRLIMEQLSAKVHPTKEEQNVRL